MIPSLKKDDEAIRSFDRAVFSAPWTILGIVFLITAIFATQIPSVRMYSDFADLLPQEHEYIQLHNEIRDTFGGANVVVVGVEVAEGTIFNNETLALIHRLTQAVDSLPGINHNLVSSLTHRTARKTWLSETGAIISDPYYDPSSPALSEQQLAELRSDVVANPRMYGLLVSPDMKAALIKGQLNEGALDYARTFEELQRARRDESVEGVTVYATGQPVLIGWVYTYLSEILQIFFLTLAIMIALLVLYFRRFYGVLVPLIAISISSVWGVGWIAVLGYNLDPLTMVIPFLISARALSHGIQLVERFYGELENCHDNKLAARRTLDSLFRPGSLGVISDAIGLLLISLGSIPINTKLAYYASLWAICVIPTVLITVPLLLSVLPPAKDSTIKHNALRALLPKLGNIVSDRARARGVLLFALALCGSGIYFSSWVQVGEAEPGSPLLYRDHDYNLSSAAINERFPGSEELYVVARTETEGGLKRPDVLHALEDFQAHMLMDPELGGAKGMPDLVKQVNRLLHNDDPRWATIPETDSYVGGLMFAYMASSPIPGALKEFLNPRETDANMVFYYKDHQGATIKRAITMVKEWKAEAEALVPGLTFHLAGGIIGVTAAINEAVFETNMIVVPAVLVLILVFVALFYRSLHAGLLMFVAMAFATTLTYAYLGLAGVGLNINTVPIIAVGIGVGIDYSIYIMDRIREEAGRSGHLAEAIRRAIGTTGLAICFTATTLVCGVIMWVFISTLRFQADAALLLCVMLVLNATAALFLVPSWIAVFRPAFIIETNETEEESLLKAAAE